MLFLRMGFLNDLTLGAPNAPKPTEIRQNALLFYPRDTTLSDL